MMHDTWMDWGWHGMWLGPLLWLALIAFVVWAALPLLRRGQDEGPRPANGATPAKSPLDILKERFAKGEIDQQEFETRRKTLES
jgi:putative membrane protein